MSSSSRGRLTRLLENNGYAVAPTSAAMAKVRRTGGSFANSSTRNPSEEVREDLQTSDSPREGFSARGSIEDEWVYGVHDEEMEDALLSTYSAAIALSSLTLTAAASDDSLTRSAGDWAADGIVVGGFYEFTGLAQGTVRARVVSIESATKITLSEAVTDEGPTASCAVKQSGHLRMGTTERWVLFEELFADISSTELWQWIGFASTGFTWQFSHPGKMRVTFNYVGKSGTSTASTAGNGTVNEYAANKVQTSVDHFIKATFLEGGSALTARIKELSLELSAPKRAIEDGGSLGPVGMGLSTFVLSGSMSLYNSVAARTIAAKHKSGALSSVEWQNLDADGNREHWWLPGLYYQGEGGTPSMGGRDSDVMITLPFTTIRSSTISSHIQHTKISAA